MVEKMKKNKNVEEINLEEAIKISINIKSISKITQKKLDESVCQFYLNDNKKICI